MAALALPAYFRARPRSVVVLPDAPFFVRSVPLVRGAEAADERTQVELALEALAPFPLAQLYWGYWTRDGCDRALVYAAYRRRFSAEEVEAWAGAEWVAPRFAVLLADEPPAAGTTWMVRGEEGLTAVHFGDASGVPTRVEVAMLAPEAEDAEVAAARDGLLRRGGGSLEVVDIDRVELEPGVPGDQEIGVVRNDRRFEVGLEAAQALDVRDAGELTHRRRARVRDAWLWRLMIAAGVVLLLSGIGEVTLWAGQFWQDGRQRQVAEQTPTVSEIETADRLANRIEELRTQRMRPFEMIALVDQPRPETIIFLRTEAEGLLTLEIEAETDTPTDINTYVSALSGLAQTAQVDILNQESRGARTTLRLRVTFVSGAFQTQIVEEAS